MVSPSAINWLSHALWRHDTRLHRHCEFNNLSMSIPHYCLLVTSNTNWPSGPQQEVFKRVGPLHGRVLRLEIKRRHLLTAIDWAHKQLHMLDKCQNIRVRSSEHGCLQRSVCKQQDHYATVSVSCYILNSRYVVIHSDLPLFSDWLGQTSPHWLLCIVPLKQLP